MRLSVLALLWAIYLSYYLGRMHFPVALPYISQELGVGYGELGGVAALFYISYSLGLLANGLLATRLNPVALLTVGGVGSAALSMYLSTVNDAAQLLALWGLNGYLQSAGWPSIVKVASYALEEREMGRGYALLNTSWALGHTLVWLFSAAIISRLGWRGCFLVNGVMLTVAILILTRPLARAQGSLVGGLEPESPQRLYSRYRLALYTLTVALVYSVVYGARSLFVVYLPSYLEGAGAPILLSALLPLSGALGMLVSAPLFDRVRHGWKPIVAGALGMVAAGATWGFPLAYERLPWLGLLDLILLSMLLYSVEAQLSTTVPVAGSGRRLSSLAAGAVDSSGALAAALASIIGGVALEGGAFYSATLVWGLALSAVMPLSIVCSRLLGGLIKGLKAQTGMI